MDKSTKRHIPLSRIQKLIGQRMLNSKLTKPCFYLEAKADITELMALRPKLRKSIGVKITTNAFYICCLGLVAKRYPPIVGSFQNSDIKIAENINVGFAVNAPQGLVVPVVKNADKKTLAEIAEEEKLLTDKARDNELTLEEMQGETIALSNLGAYDIGSFIGIIPPPASTILAVGNPVSQLVPLANQAKVHKFLSLTLAVDHRVINGHYAAQFLNHIKELLQNPKMLIIRSTNN